MPRLGADIYTRTEVTIYFISLLLFLNKWVSRNAVTLSGCRHWLIQLNFSGTPKSFILAVTKPGFPSVQFVFTVYMQHVPSYLCWILSWKIRNIELDHKQFPTLQLRVAYKLMDVGTKDSFMAFTRYETPNEATSINQYSLGHPVNKPLKYLSVLATFCLLKSYESPCKRTCQEPFPVHLCLPCLYPSTITTCQNTQDPSDHDFRGQMPFLTICKFPECPSRITLQALCSCYFSVLSDSFSTLLSWLLSKAISTGKPFLPFPFLR